MNFSRQVKHKEQYDSVFIKTLLPGEANCVQQGEWMRNSMCTSDTSQWAGEYEDRPEGLGDEKQQFSSRPLQQRIVLHIDDDEEDRMLLEEVLKKLDSEIKMQQAESGSAALYFLKQSKELGNLPCLIILDINMPGMNGKDVLREIKKDRELAYIPLILFTADSKWAHTDLIRKENIEFVTKPLTPSELFDNASKMLKYCRVS